MLKPRVKSVFLPLPPQVGADHHVRQLLWLMDGSRTTEQICAEIRDKDPLWTDEDIRAVLEQLIGAGYVEDAATAPPNVDLEELERYRRDVELFGFFNHPPLSGYDYQARLRDSRVTVVGVSGFGSYAALALATAGVGDLLLVDDGDVSADCLQRQVLCTEADIGKPRAEAAAARLSLLHPTVVTSTASGSAALGSAALGSAASGSAASGSAMSTMDGVREWMHGRDLLVCADNFATINEAALKERVPWLRCADDGLIVSMFLHVPGQTACFECERRSAAPMTSPGYADDPCSAPVSGLIGSMAALEAVKLLSGALEPATLGRKLIFDLRTMNIRFQEGVRHADCPRCRGGE